MNVYRIPQIFGHKQFIIGREMINPKVGQRYHYVDMTADIVVEMLKQNSSWSWDVMYLSIHY